MGKSRPRPGGFATNPEDDSDLSLPFGFESNFSKHGGDKHRRNKHRGDRHRGDRHREDSPRGDSHRGDSHRGDTHRGDIHRERKHRERKHRDRKHHEDKQEWSNDWNNKVESWGKAERVEPHHSHREDNWGQKSASHSQRSSRYPSRHPSRTYYNRDHSRHHRKSHHRPHRHYKSHRRHLHDDSPHRRHLHDDSPHRREDNHMHVAEKMALDDYYRRQRKETALRRLNVFDPNEPVHSKSDYFQKVIIGPHPPLSQGLGTALGAVPPGAPPGAPPPAFHNVTSQPHPPNPAYNTSQGPPPVLPSEHDPNMAQQYPQPAQHPQSTPNNDEEQLQASGFQGEQEQEEESEESEEEQGPRGMLKKLFKTTKMTEAFSSKKHRKRKIFAVAGALLGTAAVAFVGKKFFDGKKEETEKQEEDQQAIAEEEEQIAASNLFDSEGIYLGPNPLNLVPPPSSFKVNVPQNEVFIVERGGRFHRRLDAGSHTLMPFSDRISFRYSFREASLPIPLQQCYTRDSVSVCVTAFIFIRLEDPVAASYAVDKPYRSLMSLVQSCIKREFNKLSAEQAYTEYQSLDEEIKSTVNAASRPWGVRCTRFEIREVELPGDLRISLEQAAAAERQRREEVRAAEMQREIMVNRAEAEMQTQMRISQARQVDMVNQAIGEAHAISERGEAIANAMRDVAEVINEPGGEKAMHMRITEQLLKYGNTSAAGRNASRLDPNEVTAVMNDAVGLLNSLGQTGPAGNNAYAAPQVNPFNQPVGPVLNQQMRGTDFHEETSRLVNNVPPASHGHGYGNENAPVTPDMSQTTSIPLGMHTPGRNARSTYAQTRRTKS